MTAVPRCSGCSRASSSWPSRSRPGTRTGRESPSSARRLRSPPASPEGRVGHRADEPERVGEVSEANPGASSAMPHKRNPVGSVLAVACARQGRPGRRADSRARPGARARSADGMPNGRRWSGLSATRAARWTERAERSTDWRSTRSGCRRTWSRAAARPDLGSAEAFVDRALASYGRSPAHEAPLPARRDARCAGARAAELARNEHGAVDGER